MNKLKIKIALIITSIILVLNFSGCDESGGITIPSGASELTVSVKSDDNLSDAAIVFTEAKALITDVEFEKKSNGKNELHQRGPIVLKFNLNGTLQEMGTQFIIRDIYTKIKFKIHKPEENETVSDPEFKEGTGENQRYSFIIKGTYNGSNFVYKSKKSANLVINFSNEENINIKKTNITVLFNELKWLKNGSADLDPRIAQNESLIDDNIKNSFSKAIRDDNKDGLPDGN